MNKSPSILISKLVLVGHRKNYSVDFHSGVNIIFGDSATGKSSILELINYLLGSSKFIYDEEIETSVQYALLELTLNDVVYVVKRDIFQPTRLIEVSKASLENLSSVFAKKYAPSFDGVAGPDGYYSDFLLSALDLPILKVKEAPSREDSGMVRLSFRDVFRYCYLHQDDVGSKQLLHVGNWARSAKNRQALRYIFNVLDSNIAELDGEVAAARSHATDLLRKYKSVSDFLRETQFESEGDLTEILDNLNQQANFLRDELKRINQSMTADSETHTILKDSLELLVAKELAAEGESREAELSIERFSRLKNDYTVDIQKIKSIQQARTVIGQEVDDAFNCPICNSEVNLTDIHDKWLLNDADKANHEIRALSGRIRDLDILISADRDKLYRLKHELYNIRADQEKARRLLDKEAAAMISPFLSQRDGISSELATVIEKIRQSSHSMKVRNQQKSLFDDVERASARIDALEEKLTKLKKNSPSIAQILSELSDTLSKYLVFVGIRSPRETSLNSSTFLPMHRNRHYPDITSGGLRTVLSIGYYMSIFEQSLSAPINIPPFLMIDTVGKYLGKTQGQYTETDRSADVTEGVSDPSKYNNMYEYMISLADKAALTQRHCQIILVDNDVPVSIREKYAGFVNAQYSSVGEGGLPRGLIDDAHLFMSRSPLN